MRAGGSLSLFTKSKVHDKKQINMILISFFNGPGSKYFVPGYTKYVIVDHRLDSTGEEITLGLDGTNAVYSWTRAVDLSMRSKK